MRRILFLSAVALLVSTYLYAQPERIGAGLTFATKRRFGQSDTGNPGLNIKTWIALDKRMTFHLAPSLTAFNPLTINHTTHLSTSNMFHADLDAQYRVYQDRTLKVIVQAGFHMTYISSKNEMLISLPEPIEDIRTMRYGPAGGAALEMRMSSRFDFILSGKYVYDGFAIASIGDTRELDPSHYPIIQIHGVYYFVDRGRGYSKR